MTTRVFFSLFRFCCKIFFLPFKLLFEIELLDDIYFGNVLIFIMIIVVVCYIFTRPLRK